LITIIGRQYFFLNFSKNIFTRSTGKEVAWVRTILISSK